MSNSPLALRIAGDIVARINSGDLSAGSHLATEALARQYQVSRSPVREALSVLAGDGVIESRPNRGFYVRSDIDLAGLAKPALAVRAADADPYFTFAEDWLNDRIEGELTEQAVRDRYKLTRSQAQDLFVRAVQEGWAEPKPGYGWRLRPVAKTSEAFEQIYRFRAVIEPAAIMEPTFRFDRAAAAPLRRVQEKLARGQIGGLTPEAMRSAGAGFHEELIRMAGNPMFLFALERANQFRRLIEYRLKVDPQRIVAQSIEHVQILDLLERGDNLEAAHVMRRHLNGALAVKSPVVQAEFAPAPRG
ncbi:DNA-binding GntR family transcriptional regulator [Bosea sp. BE125]|uniref:GntR family transcriptional regulator n=1 Tax=Bosea sp. BE125 TaxID=2817909 RepID=UPI002863CB61|nr:GntR family transcriptional regulator [Bosea sp. BE125]MDR6869357.1 DNA-binding GntR family transcriptional regulator [Bosea sp. BE125]